MPQPITLQELPEVRQWAPNDDYDEYDNRPPAELICNALWERCSDARTGDSCMKHFGTTRCNTYHRDDKGIRICFCSDCSTHDSRACDYLRWCTQKSVDDESEELTDEEWRLQQHLLDGTRCAFTRSQLRDKMLNGLDCLEETEPPYYLDSDPRGTTKVFICCDGVWYDNPQYHLETEEYCNHGRFW